MSEIASIKFNVTIESEFKHKIFDATNNILKLTIKQMNYKDVISTCPIKEDFYDKINNIKVFIYKVCNSRLLNLLKIEECCIY